jgi:hypothetical protein
MIVTFLGVTNMYYVYNADVYCEDCGKAIRKRIKDEGFAPEYPENEYMYDSNKYPKGPYDSCETDSPEHCACGERCKNAIELPSGQKIGAWLKNELTLDGVDYVADAISEGGEVAELWAELYRDYDLETDCIDVKVVALNEEYYLPKEHEGLIKSIKGVYLYDKNKRVHCCELTPSYYLIWLYNIVELTEEGEKQREDLLDLYEGSGENEYMHCKTIDKLPSEDYDKVYHCNDYDDTLETIIEDICANLPF